MGTRLERTTVSRPGSRDKIVALSGLEPDGKEPV
jgi:hypothetical protein